MLRVSATVLMSVRRRTLCGEWGRTLCGEWASFDLLRQLFSLVLLIQRPDQFVEIAVHDIVEFVQREIDAMVGDSALREVIGADAFGTIARADLQLARLRLLALLLLAFGSEQ